jgi:hypothetical protein
MKKSIILLSVIMATLFFFACKNTTSTENKDEWVITKKISYPVFIKSPYEDTDWWVENIEGSDREKIVNVLLDEVSQGKVKAYRYTDMKELSHEEAKKAMTQDFTFDLGEIDSTINTEIDRTLIQRLTFLETWNFNKKNFDLSKSVIAVAPSITVQDTTGEIIGYRPLFWIFLNGNKPENMK